MKLIPCDNDGLKTAETAKKAEKEGIRIPASYLQSALEDLEIGIIRLQHMSYYPDYAEEHTKLTGTLHTLHRLGLITEDEWDDYAARMKIRIADEASCEDTDWYKNSAKAQMDKLFDSMGE